MEELTVNNFWNLVHIGPPDHQSVYQGTNFIIKDMNSNLEAAVMTLHDAPVDNPGKIRKVEIHHAPLRASYIKISVEIGWNTSDAEFLKQAIYSVN